MTLINKLQVERFRGIRDLSIKQLSPINLIVGDNNSGKTSLLEAIQFLRLPGNLANIYRIVRLRDAISGFNADSVYSRFIGMFPKAEDGLKIQLSGEYDSNSISYELSGTESTELFDFRELDPVARSEFIEPNGESEVDVFDGRSVFTVNGQPSVKNIRLNRFARITGTTIDPNELIKINYIWSFTHLRGNDIDRIIKDEQYKEKCLKTLQLFDPDIEDMMIFRSDVGDRPVDYLKHKRLGNMPLSTFGDGIKKFLLLSNEIARTANGILLVDEVETSIHEKYHNDIFRFLANACKEFNVQAFITTHSIEAVDGLLSSQDYEKQDTDDSITVVTLKRQDKKTYSSVLPGREVFEDREDFGFEVRL